MNLEARDGSDVLGTSIRVMALALPDNTSRFHFTEETSPVRAAATAAVRDSALFRPAPIPAIRECRTARVAPISRSRVPRAADARPRGVRRSILVVL